MLLLPATLASARATTSKVTLEAFGPVRCAQPLTSTRRHLSSCQPLRSQDETTASSASSDISARIRSLMRESAQPVALVTTFLPTSSSERLIHGATLSSFSSISLNPDLVCFSMKTPSRLADALASHVAARSSAEGIKEREGEVDMLINVLSEGQVDLAAAYARPGTPPLEHGKGEKLQGELHPLEKAGLIESEAHLPVVQGSIGALGCQIVDTVDLATYNEPNEETDSKSRLYIARVITVHLPSTTDQQPLIYHRQKFVSVTTHAINQ